MEIKFKVKDGKEILVARDLIQAAAFQKQGFVPATKEEAEKLKPKEQE